jgi:hypothetical protein
MSRAIIALAVILGTIILFLAAPITGVEQVGPLFEWAECEDESEAETVLAFEIMKDGKTFDRFEFPLRRFPEPPATISRGWFGRSMVMTVEIPDRIGGHLGRACGPTGWQGTSYHVRISEDELVKVNYSSSWHWDGQPPGEFEHEFNLSLGRSQEFNLNDGYAARAAFRRPEKWAKE